MGLITSVNAKVRQISGDVEPIDVVPKAAKIFRSVMDWAAFDQARDGAEGEPRRKGDKERREPKAAGSGNCGLQSAEGGSSPERTKATGTEQRANVIQVHPFHIS